MYRLCYILYIWQPSPNRRPDRGSGRSVKHALTCPSSSKPLAINHSGYFGESSPPPSSFRRASSRSSRRSGRNPRSRRSQTRSRSSEVSRMVSTSRSRSLSAAIGKMAFRTAVGERPGHPEATCRHEHSRRAFPSPTESGCPGLVRNSSTGRAQRRHRRRGSLRPHPAAHRSRPRLVRSIPGAAL